jgi:hypothetical protein
MRRIVGRILQFLGWLCAAWFGFVGGSFCAIYLVGYLGTSGREAGGELVLALGVTLSGLALGLIVAKFGTWVATYDSKFEA